MNSSALDDLDLEWYRSLVGNMPNGVLVLFDDALRYRVVGPDVLPFSERRAEDMVGKSVEDLFDEATVDRLRPELAATVDGEARSFDLEYDEQIHHVETRPVSLEGGQFGILLTQDVTEHRSLAAELERQNERLDEFASMLSHDIKNPLAVARGNLELYRETGDDDHYEAVERSLERISDLVVDMMGLARHGAPKESFESVSLEAVARRAWEHVETRAATLVTSPVTLTGDDGQLHALLENLFRNAVGHGGDAVTVRVGPLEDGFFVEDDGPGIAPEDRESVFEHGYSTGYGGGGIGLTVVRRIAEEHGFAVTVGESDAGGARFEFRASD